MDCIISIAPAVLAGIISGVSALGASVANGISANKQQKAQLQAQKDLIREQNEYNSPESQINRYRDAGINPYYSIGEVSGGNQSQVATAPTLVGSGQILGNSLDKGLQTMLSFAQIENIKANTNKTESETIGSNIRNEFLPLQLENDVKQGSLNIKNTELGFSKLVSEISSIDSRTALTDIQSELSRAQIKKVLADANISEINVATAELQQLGVSLNNDLVASQIVKNRIDASILSAENVLKHIQIQYEDEYLKTRNDSLSLDVFEKRWDKEYREYTGNKPNSSILGNLTGFAKIASESIVEGSSNLYKKFVKQLKK